MISILRKIRVRWQIWRGQAIDIWSKNAYPADVLSNLCSNGFRFDGVVCGSMEVFLQSLKLQDINKQLAVEYYMKAEEHAVLGRHGAEGVLDYYRNGGNIQLTENDIKRLELIVQPKNVETE